jgi:hypothetical protein
MFTPSTLPELGDDRYSTSVMPLALPAGCPLEGVRKAVGVATSIHRAAFACIDVLLERFSAAEPRRAINVHGQAYEWVVGRLSEPPQNEPFQVKYYPPSWAEIYRTHRILWTLAIFDCILNAANTRWEWSLEDKNSFIEQYVKECRPAWRAEELKTIAECLGDVYHNETITLDNRCPFMVTVPSPEKMPSTAPAHSLIPILQRIQQRKKTGKEFIGRAEARMPHRHASQPLPCISIYPEATSEIWDDWRLHLMGLVKRPEDRFCPDSSVFEDLPDPKGPPTIPMFFALFTWRSLAEKSNINEKFIPEDLPDCRFF